LGNGATIIYATFLLVFNPMCVIQHRVMGAQCGDQLGQRRKNPPPCGNGTRATDNFAKRTRSR